VADQLFVLVQVSLLEGVEVHPDDADDHGEDAIAGNYGFALDADAVSQRVSIGGEDNVTEAALDLFHDQIGIAELDNYEIDAIRLGSADEAPGCTSWR
jgi:hypothetical protein